MSKFLHLRIHRRRHDKPLISVNCIEMHNTHLLSHVGQLGQTYFTHSAPILAPRNQPLTVNKQWPPLRESRMSGHTHFNPAKKRKLPRCTVYFLVQIQFTGRYDHRYESDFVLLLCQNLSYLKYNSRICNREDHESLVKPGHACATTFLLPVKLWRGLADFNTESIVCNCCLTHVWFHSFVA